MELPFSAEHRWEISYEELLTWNLKSGVLVPVQIFGNLKFEQVNESQSCIKYLDNNSVSTYEFS